MFIKPCKLLKSIGLPLVTGTWTSRPLVLSKVTLGLISGLVSSLTPPSFFERLGTLFSNFLKIPLCFGLLNYPLRTSYSCTRLPLFSNISSLASIADCDALISSISLGKTLNMSKISFFCFKLDFLYSITASDL